VLDYHRLKTPIDHPDASVVTAKIADGAVTAAKLATLDYVTLRGLTADPPLAAGRLWFRCFPKGEKIISNLCVKAVEELKEGDLVLRSDGNGFQKIVKIAEEDFDGIIYEIKPYYLPPIKVSHNHPVLIIRPRALRDKGGKLALAHPKLSNAGNAHKPEWVFASEVRRGDVLLIPRFKVVRESNLTVRQLKLLGLYLAEGTCYKYKVRFTFGYHEGRLARYTANLLREVFRGRRVRVAKRGHAIHVEIWGKEVAEFFRRYCGGGAREKYISPELLELPPNKLKHLLLGWALGDGCFQGKLVRITTASEKLVYSTILALTKFGFVPRIYERRAQRNVTEGRVVRSGRSWDIRFPRDILERKSWSNVKQAHQWHDRDYVYVQVRDVKTIRYRGKVYHIQTEDGTIPVPFITHNSDLGQLRWTPDGSTVYVIDPAPVVDKSWSDTSAHFFNAPPGGKVWAAYAAIQLDNPATGHKRSFEDAETGYDYVHGWLLKRNAMLASRLDVAAKVGAYHGYDATRANLALVVCDSNNLDKTARSDSYPWVFMGWTMSLLGYANGAYGQPLSGYIVFTDPPSYSFSPANPGVSYNLITRIPNGRWHLLYGYKDSWAADWNQWASLQRGVANTYLRYRVATKPPEVEAIADLSEHFAGEEVYIARWDGEVRLWVRRGEQGLVLPLGRSAKVLDRSAGRGEFRVNLYERIWGSGKEPPEPATVVRVKLSTDKPDRHRQSPTWNLVLAQRKDGLIFALFGDGAWDGDKFGYYVTAI
jgi:hypothetical protein